MDFQNTDGIIFDLDGTLWDASSTCADAWNQSIKELNKGDFTVNAEFIRSISGLQIEKVFSDYFTFIPKEIQPELLETYKKNEVIFMRQFGGKLFPGTITALNELKKQYKLFIVSNCLPGYIENFIAFYQLENVFADFECSGNTGLTKAENIQLIVQRNRLTNPVYIGDTPWDQEAAQKAGVPFIHAAYGFQKVDAKVSVNSMDELSAFFAFHKHKMA